MLQIRPNCECCNKDLPPTASEPSFDCCYTDHLACFLANALWTMGEALKRMKVITG